METVRQYYDDRSEKYDAEQRLLYFRVYDEITWKHTRPLIPRNADARVLDAAGGTGKWAIPIAQEGPRVVLVDLSRGMLDVTYRKVAQTSLGSRVEIHQGDITKLDFDDETFDMVFCDHALCFVNDMEKAVRELARVLKEGSPIVISAQNRYPLALSILASEFEKGARILRGEELFMMQNRVPVHTLCPQEFRGLLERNGLEVRKMVGKGVVLTSLVLPMERFWTDNYGEAFASNLMKLEIELSERSDTLALAGHIQAIGYRSPRSHAKDTLLAPIMN